MKKNDYKTISIIVLFLAVMLMVCSCHTPKNPFVEQYENAVVVDKSDTKLVGDTRWIRLRIPNETHTQKIYIVIYDWETLNLGDTIKIQK